MSTLERAISIAAAAHAGQVDKAGAAYVLHPLRVMLAVSKGDAQIVAVLHDVVEDTEVSVADLRRAGFSEQVIEALDSVTKRAGEDYQSFVLRAASNAIGRQVKLADLTDNCDLSRISEPVQKDFDRVAKYQTAISVLNSLPR